jgi:hypothetical protein
LVGPREIHTREESTVERKFVIRDVEDEVIKFGLSPRDLDKQNRARGSHYQSLSGQVSAVEKKKEERETRKERSGGKRRSNRLIEVQLL